jgi:hypothetical protein
MMFDLLNHFHQSIITISFSFMPAKQFQKETHTHKLQVPKETAINVWPDTKNDKHITNTAEI